VGGPFGLARPDALYFYDWGKPRDLPSSVAELRTIPCGADKVYQREFEHGYVWVNPSDRAVTCAVESGFYDVSAERPATAASVKIGARDAAFLLRGR